MRSSVPIFALLAAVILTIAGCSSSGLSSAKEVRFGKNGNENKPAVTQVELQEDLQRLTSNFLERLGSSTRGLLDSRDPILRQTASRQVLRYFSSSLDIASGPYPEVNLLDMTAFIRLCRELLQDYWIPKIYGDKGRALLSAFVDAENDLQVILDKVTTRAQQSHLDELIRSWRQEHPNEVEVEGVRLADFSLKAGRIVSERNDEVSGLLANMKGAVLSADQALLLGNRAMYLAQRMPFLLRLQARIGAQEVLMDSSGQLSQGADIVDHLNPLVENLLALVTQTSGLLKRFREQFPHDTTSTFTQKLSTGESITRNLRDASDSAFHASGFTKALIMIGAAWSLFWWGGYFIANRAVARLQRTSRTEKNDSEPPSKAAA